MVVPALRGLRRLLCAGAVIGLGISGFAASAAAQTNPMCHYPSASVAWYYCQYYAYSYGPPLGPPIGPPLGPPIGPPP